MLLNQASKKMQGMTDVDAILAKGTDVFKNLRLQKVPGNIITIQVNV